MDTLNATRLAQVNSRLITVAQVIAWNPCYTDLKVRSLAPSGALAPLAVARLPIQTADKLWVLLREEVLGELLPEVMLRIVTRAVANHAQASSTPLVSRWAARWLKGKSRSLRAVSRAAAEAKRVWESPRWQHGDKSAVCATAAAEALARYSARDMLGTQCAFAASHEAVMAAVCGAPGGSGRDVSELELQLRDVVDVLEGR
jgi:hypothetical protein